MTRATQPRPEEPAPRNGFTLTELVVLAAAAGILVAVTLPVLSGAHTEALTESSMNNLRQIHLLLLVYVRDYDGYWPKPLGDQTNPGDTSYTWRRNVWEHAYGPFPSGEYTAAMNAPPYSHVMWCPLMVSQFGQQQHPVGRGSYAMAKYFQVSYTCSSSPGPGACTYRRQGDPAMVGKLEPIVMTGSVGTGGALDPSFGTYDLVEWGTYTSNPVPDPENGWKYLNYGYGNAALGVYLDGHVGRITVDQGTNYTFCDAINGFDSLP